MCQGAPELGYASPLAGMHVSSKSSDDTVRHTISALIAFFLPYINRAFNIYKVKKTLPFAIAFLEKFKVVFLV